MQTESVHILFILIVILSAALIGGFFARFIKQPILLGYIVGGIVAGSMTGGLLQQSFIQLIADAGVTLLLFTIGLEFSFHRLAKTARQIFFPAFIQIISCIAIFFLLLFVLGFPFMTSIFVAIAASLSSTAVIIKYLNEKEGLETTSGNVLTTWSILQDLSVIPILFLLPVLHSFSTQGPEVKIISLIYILFLGILKSLVALALVIILSKRIVPQILSKVAKIHNRELFMLMTVITVFLAALASSYAGLSPAIGAFLAGIIISESSQNHAVFAEIRPLRDLFATIFFVSLGLVLPLSYIWAILPILICLTIIIALVKIFIIWGLLKSYNYHDKTAVLVSLFLIPMSEFGFIVGREGVKYNALTNDQYLLLVGLTFFSILLSAPIVSNSQKIYYWLIHHIHFNDKKYLKNNIIDYDNNLKYTDHIVICGYGRVGRYIGRALDMVHIPYVVVDFNHTTISNLSLHGVPVVFGDPGEIEILKAAGVMNAKILVVAIPDFHTQELIIAHAQTINRRIHIISRTHHEEDQKLLKSLGVHTIIQPEFEAALSVIEKLMPAYGISNEDISGKISRLKIEHGIG